MHGTIPDIRRDVVKAHTMVSDIDRTVNGQEGGDDRNPSVSDTRTLAVAE